MWRALRFTIVITPPPGSKSIDQLLAAARARLHRLSPIQALAAMGRGALLVDIRPHAQRVTEGEA